MEFKNNKKSLHSFHFISLHYIMSDILSHLNLYFKRICVPTELCQEIFKYLDIKNYMDENTRIDILTQFFALKKLCSRFVSSCTFCQRDITGIIKCRDCKSPVCVDCRVKTVCFQHINCYLCQECKLFCKICKIWTHKMVKECVTCGKNTCLYCSYSCKHCRANVCRQCTKNGQCKSCIDDTSSLVSHLNEKFKVKVLE